MANEFPKRIWAEKDIRLLLKKNLLSSFPQKKKPDGGFYNIIDKLYLKSFSQANKRDPNSGS